MAMGNTTMEEGPYDNVHYNPSDLSGWVDSMLSELSNSNMVWNDDDLRAIPGGAILSNNNKRTKPTPGSEFPEKGSFFGPAAEAEGPMVLVDSQESGVRLVHTLVACAEAVQQENMKLADALVKNVAVLAVSQVGAMRKVATYFAEALAGKIYKIYPQDTLDSSYGDVLQIHFYETGMQWPDLMQALALRPGGPPVFRLTGIGPPQPDNTGVLQQVGLKLVKLAETIGIEFEFRGFVANSLADFDKGMFDIGPGDVEAVAINSIFELHGLLSRPGAIDKVLNLIKAINPKIVTIVEQEANHNGNDFLERFSEALHYYSTIFDSLESSWSAQSGNQDLVMAEVYLGRQICNVVASEGAERVERHETLARWRRRLNSAGFDPFTWVRMLSSRLVCCWRSSPPGTDTR
ncbi:hypothetical protein OROMI_012670 [Orobanche minor]